MKREEEKGVEVEEEAEEVVLKMEEEAEEGSLKLKMDEVGEEVGA